MQKNIQKINYVYYMESRIAFDVNRYIRGRPNSTIFSPGLFFASRHL